MSVYKICLIMMLHWCHFQVLDVGLPIPQGSSCVYMFCCYKQAKILVFTEIISAQIKARRNSR